MARAEDMIITVRLAWPVFVCQLVLSFLFGLAGAACWTWLRGGP